MFGALRLFLSFLVVISHLMGNAYFTHFGFYAVRGFFVLSGFIITAGLNEIYRFDGVRFWANRLLRLLPIYYVVCLATLVAIAFLPNETGEFLSTWKFDAREGSDVLMNLLVLPLQFGEPTFRLLPPYWSIAVEIEMYLLLWIVIARREAYAAVALAVGISYHLACMFDGLDWQTRYFAPPSALLSFALGALLYFWRKRGWLDVGPGTACVALAAWMANMMAGGLIFSTSYIYDIGYYLSAVFFFFVAAGLARGTSSPVTQKIDHALGELAYPVFIAQWVVSFAVWITLVPDRSRGLMLTAIATPAILLVAYGIAWLGRRYVDPLRTSVRGFSIEHFNSPAENATLVAGRLREDALK